MFKRKVTGSQKIKLLIGTFKKVADELMTGITEAVEEINFNKDRVEEAEKEFNQLKVEVETENTYLQELIKTAQKYVNIFDGTVAQ